MISFCVILLLLGTIQNRCNADTAIPKLYDQADLVVIAKVMKVKPSELGVEMWSGPVAVTQQVKYEIQSLLKGEFSDKEIFVNHYVVKGSRTADTKEPRLSPKLFRRGQSLLLFVRVEERNGSTPILVAFGENCGSSIATQSLVKRIKRLSKKPS